MEPWKVKECVQCEIFYLSSNSILCYKNEGSIPCSMLGRDVPQKFFIHSQTFNLQDSSEDDSGKSGKSGKGPKKLAFGSRTSVRRSTEPSTSEESKEGDDSESGGDGGGAGGGGGGDGDGGEPGKDEKGKKVERKEKGGKNGEGKDVSKGDKEKIKGATMTTPKKVRINFLRNLHRRSLQWCVMFQ